MTLTADVVAACDWIDLSQPLTGAATRSKLHGDVRIWADRLEFPTCHVQVTHIDTAVHVGTHYDAPLHFYDGAKAIDEYEPERFVRHAVVARMPHGPGDAVTVRDLAATLSRVDPGDFVFLAFGFGALCSSPDYYDFPYLEPEAAEYLVGLGIAAFGTDTLSPDAPAVRRGRLPEYPNHEVFLRNDVLIMENLGSGLERVAGERVLVVAPPLPLVGADGAMTVPYALRPRD